MDINLLQIFSLLVIILISMTVHEMMHAYVGYWLGDSTAKDEGRLSINPLAHIDPFMTILLPLLLAVTGAPIFGGAKPVPFNPHNLRWGELGSMLVALAGPFTNLLLAFVGFSILALTDMNSTIQYILQLWVLVNLGFFVFNMLPIPPLDGSRLIYYLAPNSVRRFMEVVEQYGIIIIFALILLFSPYLTSFMQLGINFFLSIFTAIFAGVI
ncbi:zinc metalloprotease ywhC [Candidatus Saccharibacteria bacterium RIFCSPHIGHO2_12_FULL_42_8]|nr:MAG: zinc metalloprotease ywhC [Candidatus Saccharibacteria bacterium RIFCSPHIGHO2_12_FULL_42_8]